MPEQKVNGPTILYRVCLPYATFGIEVCDDVVVDAAPIGHWMIGKKLFTVRGWILRKGGTFLKVSEHD